jgi:hypothetical protein
MIKMTCPFRRPFALSSMSVSGPSPRGQGLPYLYGQFPHAEIAHGLRSDVERLMRPLRVRRREGEDT